MERWTTANDTVANNYRNNIFAKEGDGVDGVGGEKIEWGGELCVQKCGERSD